MLTGMCSQVDLLSGYAHSLECRLYCVLERHDESDDRAVVRLVGRSVEDSDAFDSGDRITNGPDDFGSSAFRKIGNALYQFHLQSLEPDQPVSGVGKVMRYEWLRSATDDGQGARQHKHHVQPSQFCH